MVERQWVSYSDIDYILPMERLSMKMKRLKPEVIEWDKAKKVLEKKALCLIEAQIAEITA